ncbi:MAG: winged helix-turn-helix transcriptional regulator [Desulfobacterales bacterium]|nr:MAG: winged helix-turn-helix transcriptional regulator [Desulfobacterales bacterium]
MDANKVAEQTERPPLDRNLQAPAFLAKSLSDENRLRILLCVRNRKKSVSGIVEELHLSQPLVSHHLKELRRALLVEVERNGPFVFYKLADGRVIEILRKLHELAQDLVTHRTGF